MADYRHHFAFIILNECHLCAIAFAEEICFRFGIKNPKRVAIRFPEKPARLNDLLFAG